GRTVRVGETAVERGGGTAQRVGLALLEELGDVERLVELDAELREAGRRRRGDVIGRVFGVDEHLAERDPGVEAEERRICRRVDGVDPGDGRRLLEGDWLGEDAAGEGGKR